jgi:acyl carrier protein
MIYLDTSNRADFERDLVRWINRELLRGRARVDETTPLFEGGLIDSLRILGLIAWTERRIGRRIPDEQIRMDHFRDVRTIARTFVEE